MTQSIYIVNNMFRGAKKRTKRLFSSLVFNGYPKIVVTSTGRAGSTMLYEAVVKSLIRHRLKIRVGSRLETLAKNLVAGYVERLESLSEFPGMIAKSHDVYPGHTSIDCKFIFVYGDPLASAKSVEQMVDRHGEGWFNLHQCHLGGNGTYENLFEADVLNYEGLLNSWMRPSLPDVICVEYENIWQENDRLSKFLGFALRLPKKIERRKKPQVTDINMDLFERLRNVKCGLKYDYDVRERCNRPEQKREN